MVRGAFGVCPKVVPRTTLKVKRIIARYGFLNSPTAFAVFFIAKGEGKHMAVKRICLFAGYSSQNTIEDYVIHYIKNLTPFADVFYCADNPLTDEEIKKLAPYVKIVFSGRHATYDFGSWAKMINAIGWDEIEKYDQMILVNDSCFGPLFPLTPVFEKMDSIPCDAWGIAKNKFLMSFFLCFGKAVINDPIFRDFISTPPIDNNKLLLIEREKSLSAIISRHRAKAFLDKTELKSLYKSEKKKIKKALRSVLPLPVRLFVRTRVDKIRLYDNEALLYPLMEFPFLKKNAFYNMGCFIPTFGISFVKHCTDYDPRLIESCVSRYGSEKPSVLKYLKRRWNAAIMQNITHLQKKFRKKTE